MMTSASIAAQSTEFVHENFAAKDIDLRTEVLEDHSIIVSHTITLPAGNFQAVIKASADEKVVIIEMGLCANSLLNSSLFCVKCDSIHKFEQLSIT
jgi:hypothetical protein